MQYTPDMNLLSESGYCMPFASEDARPTLLYGEQTHPTTKQKFFHHGVDFGTNNYTLAAVATGKVTGLGEDSVRGYYQTIRYGKYEVTYYHITNVIIPLGKMVKAGAAVSKCGKLLHIGVKYNGEEIDPIDFLEMIWNNIIAQQAIESPDDSEDLTFAGDLHTKYDKDMDEIQGLIDQFYPSYLSDYIDGEYRAPSSEENKLRNLFSMARERNYFFEVLPNFLNPFGATSRILPIVEKLYSILLGDFLNYLTTKHDIYLSTFQGEKKK